MITGLWVCFGILVGFGWGLVFCMACLNYWYRKEFGKSQKDD